MPRHISRILCVLLVALFTGVMGCGSKKTSSDDQMDIYKSDPPEMMPIAYTPRDDGLPLSANELHAFKTVGPLDRHLTAEEARDVELHFKNYVHQNRATMQRYVDRSARFIPLIKKNFKARGIPEDIAYLCMVESGGNPNARSHAGAVGLWQFMPATGRAYGLRQNSWIDERRDPYKASFAASDYLLKLYNDFSNWHLAIAAYNAGEGKIGRAVNGTGAGNFFELCRLDGQLDSKARLKQETRDYVPRLLAMTKIMRNLKLLGFQTPPPNAAWNLTPMKMPPGVNLAGLARQLGLTWDEFSGMNPAYRTTASPPNDQSTVYLPPALTTAALNWVTSPEARIFEGMREYTVSKGDTLASIARQHKVSESALIEANGFTSLPMRGSVILIPPTDATAAPVYQAMPQSATAPSASAGAYTVRQGDTLASLSRTWGTDVSSIRLANRMGKKDELTPGQRISIPGNAKTPGARPRPQAVDGRVPALPTPNRSSVHIVQQGENVATIARMTGVSFAALCEANNLDKKNPIIRPGQKLSIPGQGSAVKETTAVKAAPAAAAPQAVKAPGKAAQPEQKGVPEVYTVRYGDTLMSLSRRWGVKLDAICKANGLSRTTTLRTGQKIVPPTGATLNDRRETPAVVSPAPDRPAQVKPAPEKPATVKAAPEKPAQVKPAPDKPATPAKPAPAKAPLDQEKRDNLDRQARQARQASQAGQSSRAADKAGGEAKAERDTGPARSGSRVTVKEGDTLYGIARANSVSVEALQKVNNLGVSTRVKVGQKLLIP